MKKWLVERFLPMWAKQTVLRENAALREKNRALVCRVRELEAFIRGMKSAKRKVENDGR